MGCIFGKNKEDDNKGGSGGQKPVKDNGGDKPNKPSKGGNDRAPIPGREVNAKDLEDDFIIFEPLEDYYILGDEIGKGGFSIVYQAERKKDQKEFAVKCIKKDMVEGEDIKLLRREVQIMKKLDHPNILKLYEVYEDDKQFFLVMELVKGKELFDKIVERGMYSERDASNIIFQVVSAVDYLHHNGIAHRDLKPENLLSAGEGENEIIKIADFGFSKSFAGDDAEKFMTSCGSPGYVAPEILTAESYDKSVDMWSVGVIIYILLSGYPPFYADSAPALFKKIMDVKYDFEDSVWDDISDSAKDLIRNLLVKEPSKRFTAKQCLQHPWVKGAAANDNAILNVKKFRTELTN